MGDATATTPNDGFEFVIAEPGVELAVQRSGEGPTVLLAGGLIPAAEFAQIDGVGHGGIFTGPGDSVARITQFCCAHRHTGP